jgi:glycosyltransferase involved in cell wall biosynthesis
MISAIIPTFNDAERLTATLSALAPAAIDGFVREVIVADGGSNDGTVAVAEDAGADVFTRGLDLACAKARQPWLLFLAAGSRPQVGWEQAARAHMRDHPDKAGWFDLALAEPGPAARLQEAAARFENVVFGRLRAPQGLLVRRELLAELGAVREYGEIVSWLGRLRLRSMGVRVLSDSH